MCNFLDSFSHLPRYFRNSFKSIRAPWSKLLQPGAPFYQSPFRWMTVLHLAYSVAILNRR